VNAGVVPHPLTHADVVAFVAVDADDECRVGLQPSRSCSFAESLHVSRRDKDLRLRVREATEAAQHRLARAEPSVRTVADQAGLSESDAVRGQLALRLYKQPPLDATTAAADIAATDDDFERVDDRALVDALVAELPRLDRTIVEAYYLEGRSQTDISRQVGRSQMFVSRRLARSRNTLRQIAVGTGTFG
jgi:RNA polymerase sigma factor (sigma-70 family)